MCYTAHVRQPCICQAGGLGRPLLQVTSAQQGPVPQTTPGRAEHPGAARGRHCARPSSRSPPPTGSCTSSTPSCCQADSARPLARMTHSRQDGRARRLGLSRDTHDSGVAFDLMGSLDDLRDYDQWSSDSAATNFPRRPHARDEATRRCRFPGLVRFRLWCTDGRRCSRLRYLGGFLFCGFGTCGRRLGRVLLETAVLVLAAGAARTRFIAPWPCTGWSSH